MYLYENRPKKNSFKTFFIIFATSIITAGVIKFAPLLNQVTAKSPNENTIERLSVSSDSFDFNNRILSTPEIIKNSMDSIVGISILQPDANSIFSIGATNKWGLGTGVIVSENGYILTNQHLASKVNSLVTVTLNNGNSTQGKVIWTEENLDLAIVKINANNLTPLPIGDSDNVIVGEEVIAIGNPIGIEFQRSATKGIVSGINRTLKVEDDISSVIMENLIQTDASINTGNSGGPLINSNGEIIGINTVKITSAEGIGFAVPINVVRPIVEKLSNDDEFSEAYLGLYAYDNEILPYVDSRNSDIHGIYVASIVSDGPAEKADILVGDIITKVDNIPMTKMIDLREYLYSKLPGESLRVEVSRNNKTENLIAILSEKTP
ncbi:MAG: trypsin-like peptidase domain-containing protein [Clostridia bacterium]|nr:trypsin-like peptidase domain-containing protein [Clostridia bacterium]